MRRLLFIAASLAGLGLLPVTTETAQACPMCAAANDSAGDARSRAYMVSILFMLAMPATVLTGFGIGFYRLSKRPHDLVEPDTACGFADR